MELKMAVEGVTNASINNNLQIKNHRAVAKEDIFMMSY